MILVVQINHLPEKLHSQNTMMIKVQLLQAQLIM